MRSLISRVASAFLALVISSESVDSGIPKKSLAFSSLREYGGINREVEYTYPGIVVGYAIDRNLNGRLDREEEVNYKSKKPFGNNAIVIANVNTDKYSRTPFKSEIFDVKENFGMMKTNFDLADKLQEIEENKAKYVNIFRLPVDVYCNYMRQNNLGEFLLSPRTYMIKITRNKDGKEELADTIQFTIDFSRTCEEIEDEMKKNETRKLVPYMSTFGTQGWIDENETVYAVPPSGR